jgi:uncharacterized protein (TIGR02611 family)
MRSGQVDRGSFNSESVVNPSAKRGRSWGIIVNGESSAKWRAMVRERRASESEQESADTWSGLSPTRRHAKRVITGAVGTTIVIVGLVLLVLPGPALVVIPAGLAILATEFVWARRLLSRVRDKAGQAIGRGNHRVRNTTE